MIKILNIFLALFVIPFLLFCLFTIAYAQTPSSPSAVIPFPILPTLFPTVTPSPTTSNTWPLLEKLDAIATPPAPTISSMSATPVASGSAQDFCLKVPIVMYHHVEPVSIATQLGHPQLTEDSNIFEDHVRFLIQNHYHLLSLEDLVNAILNRKSVPDKSIVLTFDDGYIDDYTYAFLMAKKYHVILNFMIPTGLIGQSDYMTWDHLKEMAASPYARIYNHTTSHAPLGLIDQNQIEKEITTANQQLEQNLGIKNDIVVYPYGSYNDLAIQTLQQLGMIAGLSTDPGTNDCISNIMKLPRVRVGNEPIEDYGF